MWTFVLATIAAFVVVALVWTTASLQRSIATVVRDTRSQAIATEVQLSLLTYQRLSNLYALTDDPQLDIASDRLAEEMRGLLVRARHNTRYADEKALVDRASRNLSAYLDQRDRLEAREADLPTIVHLTRPNFEATYDDVSELHRVNDAQVERTSVAVTRTARAAVVVALSAGLAIAVGLLIVVVIIRQFTVRPMLALSDTIARFRKGERDARASMEGIEEVNELALAFNEMADALARQHEDQLAFLAGVAHDLRDPLTGLRIGIHALGAGQPEPQRTSTCERLDRQIERLARLVTDLLDAARIESGNLELKTGDVDLNEVVLDAVRLYGPTSPRHRITTDLPPEPVHVRGDTVRIEQVIGNLLSNAIKYSPRGGSVRISLRPERDEVMICVADQGIGIAREEVGNIFLPFRRSQPGVAPGVGLGLSVVRRIVEAHGGRVEVESELGVGSMFRVRIPRAVTEAAPRASTPVPATALPTPAT